MSTMEQTEQGLSIKETAERTGLSQDTLRFYEKEGLIFPVHRLPNGHRRFSRSDLDWLGFIKCLRSTGMPHSEIISYKQLLEQGERAFDRRRSILLRHRDKIRKELEDLQSALGAIEWKIEHHYSIEKGLQE